MVNFIPYGRQHITEEDIEAVAKALRSDFLTTGPAVAAFENAMAERLQTPRTLTMANATVALHMAYLTLGLGTGGRLWTSPNTFMATSNAALYCGAAVDFVDTDPKTFCMDPQALKTKLQEAEKKGTLPDIVAPVHFGGRSCDMKAIGALAETYGFKVVEDAAHAVGATYESDPVGNCRFSEACVFSFHPVKIITTAEGGLLSFRDPENLEKAEALRAHGIVRHKDRLCRQSEGGWYHEMHSLGFNYRMTDIQAALGASQLGTLDENLKRRAAIVARYRRDLSDLPLHFQSLPASDRSAHHLCVILTEDAARRRALYDFLHQGRIGAQVHYIPVYTQPYYRRLGFTDGLCPTAEDYYSRCLSIPLYHGLTDDQQSYVIETIRQFFGRL